MSTRDTENTASKFFPSLASSSVSSSGPTYPLQSSPLQGLLHLSRDINFPTIYILPFGTLLASSSRGPFSHFCTRFPLTSQARPDSFRSHKLCHEHPAGSDWRFPAEGFYGLLFPTQRCSLLWTLLCLEYTSVAKSRTVNTVTAPRRERERPGVARQQ